LIARLDQLAQEVKEVVQTASVLGREFEVRVLAQMLAPVSEIEAYVSDAEKASIWLPLREMRYLFYHALLRDAAYSMQMRARRKELHVLALGALEKIYESQNEEHYAEFAYHAENGDLRAKAQQYYTRAGRVSAGLYQNNQAIDYFTRALAYTPFDDLVTQFDLVVERVELYSRLGKRDLQLKDLDQLEHWAGVLVDDDLRIKVMMLRSAYCYFVGNYQESVKYAELSESASETLAVTKLAHYTQFVRATSLLRLGRMDAAMQLARQSLEKVRALKYLDEECQILNVMGWIALEQKESSSAKEYLAGALEIARRVKNQDVESKVLNNLAMAEGFLNGDYALARIYYDRSYKIIQELGDRQRLGVCLANLGYVAGMQGDFSAARSYYEQALMTAHEVGDLYAESQIYVNLSALDGIQKNADAARKNAFQAAEIARKASDRSGEAWALLYLGHAHLLQNEFESARDAYQASINIRTELNQLTLSMEPLAGLVGVSLAKDDPESASVSAEKILGFLESGSTLDGVEEPLRVLYTCYMYLRKQKDPRSMQILQKAKEMLDAQVSKFSDEGDRKRYVENIPWRRAVWDAARTIS